MKKVGAQHDIENTIEFENIAKVEVAMNQLAYDLQFLVDVGVSGVLISELEKLEQKCYKMRQKYQNKLLDELKRGL